MSTAEIEINEAEMIETDPTGFVKSGFLAPGATLPLVMQPAAENVTFDEFTSWLRANRDFVERQLVKYGAILFRDFPVSNCEDFEQFGMAVSDELLEYRERSSPRSQVGENVYTSTDYPPSQKIFPHKLFFFCEIPATRGGETPIGDTRKILQRIRPEIRERFRQKKWMYMRNFGHGMGVPWRKAFATEDKAVVEDYAKRNKIDLEWKANDCLRTRQVRPAFETHPRTGELLWFNHLTFFHISTLDDVMREVLMEEFADEDLPNNTYYGDGSPIEPSVMEHLRDAYMKEMVSFKWQKGDTIILDKMLTAHSRLTYAGPRKVLFAMADPITREV